MRAKLIVVVTILLAVTGCKQQTQQTPASNSAPAVVQAAAPAVVATSSPASAPPAASTAAPEKTREPMDEGLKPPVALEQIEGEWWTDRAPNKVFAFIESGDLVRGRYSLSLPSGAKLTVRCLASWPIDGPSDAIAGRCPLLPVMHWTRMAVSDVVTNPDDDQWGLWYRGTGSDIVSGYLVENICYSNGSCRSSEELVKRAREKLREKESRGEN